MHAVLGKLVDVARHKPVLCTGTVKGLLAPVQDGLQHRDVAVCFLYLVVGLAVHRIHARRCIGTVRFPAEVRHDGLELSAGNDGVAADFSILLYHKYGKAVLCRLCSSSNTGTARAHNNYVIGVFDGSLCSVHNGVLLEVVHLGGTGFLCSVVQGVANRHRRKGCTGNDVHAGTVCSDCICEHDVIGRSTDVRGFAGSVHLDVGDGAVAECNVEHHRTVHTLTGAGIRTGLVLDRYVLAGLLRRAGR